jgi:uncharacterized protein
MAAQDVELVKGIYGFNWAGLASREEGLAVALQMVDPEFEYQLDPEIWDRTLRGVEGLRVFLEGVEQDFKELRHDPDEFIDAGDRVVVLGHVFGLGRLSGVPLRSPFGHVWTLRDEKVLRLEGYLDHDQAREVAGVSS